MNSFFPPRTDCNFLYATGIQSKAFIEYFSLKQFRIGSEYVGEVYVKQGLEMHYFFSFWGPELSTFPSLCVIIPFS